jgi:D-arabinose 1-dehydrogenase-like Zn-dependent alcohol dehydrogenase
LDTFTGREILRTRLLATDGKGKFVETLWEKPQHTSNDISVKALITGVCRSDIDMMQGNFGPLPLHMQGHEGLAKVCEVGSEVLNVKVGDIVATRGEPAYADYYNVRNGEFVVVPSAEPKYILEPVACGINLINQAKDQIEKRQGANARMLILGSGFLAWVAFHTMRLNGYFYHVDVIGSNNKDLWGDILKSKTEANYDVVIDLSDKTDVFDKDILRENALIIFGSQKTVTTDFSNLLWKACTMVFPSPRNPEFIDCMHFAKHWIENGYINVDSFWTRSYNRDTEWQQAFEDGINRPQGYSRGYIKWD